MTDANGPVSQAAGGKKSDAAKATKPSVERTGAGGLLDLQRGAGNQAVGGLLTRAAADSGRPLDGALRQSLEQGLGADLSRVRIHDGADSATAAESIGARAYTVGSDIHLGRDTRSLDRASLDRLLTHEAVHAVQQGGRPAPLDGVMPVSRPSDSSEAEARTFADALSARSASSDSSAVSASSSSPMASLSPALALRDSLRATTFAPHIQRDIDGTHKFAGGDLTIAFKKADATAAGAVATEVGEITFAPNATAPESDAIKFIQIVRTFDTGTGKQNDYAGTPEANRNKMQTERNNPKNIAPGFFVDQLSANLAQRTKKTDAAVQPFFDTVGSPRFVKQIGQRRGATRKDAILFDEPRANFPLKFNFVTVAKAADTGCVYGVVLWGFETFNDKKGITKIKNEYRSFRTFEGETFVDAVKRFNEFYKNPGTPGAPAT